jgi:hypothetical protein
MIHDYTKNIISELNCDVWIETGIGDGYGGSIYKIHNWFPEIIQYEVDVRQKTIDNLMSMNLPKKFIFEQGNSPEFLKKHITDISNYNLPIFFLDAHTNNSTDYWPLRDELKVILDLPKCVIVIDDFKHPTKPFNYDSHQGAVGKASIPSDLNHIKDLLKTAKVKSVYHCKESAMNNMGVVFLFKGIVYNNDTLFDEEPVN